MSFRQFSALSSLSRALALAGIAVSGCGTATSAARSEADQAKTVEALRAQNAAYARKLEELENQVFLLNGELDARRTGEPPAASLAPAPPPVLPEVKLSRGERAPEPELPGERPETLVEGAAIEYAGAAAERTGKRPLLRLYGSPADATAEPEMVEPPRPVAVAPPRTSTPAPVRTPAATPARASAPPPAAPAARPAAARGPASEAGLRLYQEALDHLRAGRHQDAVASFREFVKQHPHHDLADNAQYWLGECFYDRKDYSTALREFRRVAEKFPQGNKAPDALLKVAFSYLALGSARPAREALQEIVRNYPGHQAAGLAKAKIVEIDGSTLSNASPRGAAPAGSQKEMY